MLLQNRPFLPLRRSNRRFQFADALLASVEFRDDAGLVWLFRPINGEVQELFNADSRETDTLHQRRCFVNESLAEQDMLEDYTVFRQQYQNIGGADTIEVGKNNFVEVGAQFAVEQATGVEQFFGAFDSCAFDNGTFQKFTGVAFNMLKANVIEIVIRSCAGIDTFVGKLANLADAAFFAESCDKSANL
jgi:hypothetical protein